jgi:hypothetical protein
METGSPTNNFQTNGARGTAKGFFVLMATPNKIPVKILNVLSK